MRWVALFSIKGVVLLATASGLAIGFLVFRASDHDVSIPLPESVVRSAVEREVAVAREVGLVMADQGRVAVSPEGFDRVALADGWQSEHECLTRPLRIEAGECVALVVGLSGEWIANDLSLRPEGRECQFDRDHDVATDDEDRGVVRHVQWCSPEAQTLGVTFHMRAQVHKDEKAGVLHYAVLRGKSTAVGGIEGLTRGYVKSGEPGPVDAWATDALARERLESDGKAPADAGSVVEEAE